MLRVYLNEVSLFHSIHSLSIKVFLLTVLRAIFKISERCLLQSDFIKFVSSKPKISFLGILINCFMFTIVMHLCDESTTRKWIDLMNMKKLFEILNRNSQFEGYKCSESILYETSPWKLKRQLNIWSRGKL